MWQGIGKDMSMHNQCFVCLMTSKCNNSQLGHDVPKHSGQYQTKKQKIHLKKYKNRIIRERDKISKKDRTCLHVNVILALSTFCNLIAP